ncbi:MAG: hypothetical protein ACPF9D_01485 [Owenweeksia sp.]
MKKANLSLIIVMLTFLACKKPTKDVQLHIRPSFYKYVVELELNDLSGIPMDASGSLTVNVTGEDAQAIYDISGSSTVKVNYGNNIQLIIAKGTEPNAQNPVRFNVEISGNDFYPVLIPIAVGPEDYYIFRNVSLLSRVNLPAGIGYHTTSGALSGGRLGSALSLNAYSDDGTSEMILTIPDNIDFFNQQGQKINSGNLQVEVLSFSDTSFAGQMTLPNGGTIMQRLYVDQGQEISVALDPSSTFMVNMEANGQEVKSFGGNGVSMRISIPDIAFNTAENRPYQVGDSVGLMSYSEGETAWKLEPEQYELKDDGSGLYFNAAVKHLSVFHIGAFVVWGDFNPFNPISNPSGGDRVFINGQEILESIRFKYLYKSRFNTPDPFGSLYGDIRFKILRQAYGPYNIYLKGFFHPNGGPLERYTSNTTQVNGLPQIISHSFGPSYTLSAARVENFMFFTTFEITITPPPQIPITVSYELECDGVEVSPPIGTKLYFRRSIPGAASYFRLFHIVTHENQDQREIKLFGLTEGEAYDVRALLGSTERIEEDVILRTDKVYEVKVPASVCEELGLR